MFKPRRSAPSVDVLKPCQLPPPPTAERKPPLDWMNAPPAVTRAGLPATPVTVRSWLAQTRLVSPANPPVPLLVWTEPVVPPGEPEPPPPPHAAMDRWRAPSDTRQPMPSAEGRDHIRVDVRVGAVKPTMKLPVGS